MWRRSTGGSPYLSQSLHKRELVQENLKGPFASPSRRVCTFTFEQVEGVGVLKGHLPSMRLPVEVGGEVLQDPAIGGAQHGVQLPEHGVRITTCVDEAFVS